MIWAVLGVFIFTMVAPTIYMVSSQRRYVLGKEVFLKFDHGAKPVTRITHAYVYLKNRIFVNSHLIKSGLGFPRPSTDHRLAGRFRALKGDGRS